MRLSGVPWNQEQAAQDHSSSPKSDHLERVVAEKVILPHLDQMAQTEVVLEVHQKVLQLVAALAELHLNQVRRPHQVLPPLLRPLAQLKIRNPSLLDQQQEH
mmetsp:Transcript_61252/g.109016  ORF Transcript_61252/g.109016 Transcript_61252/m.109016 type:complete len:102 (+) Transcript_61252:1659-1964(+)